MYVLGIDVGTTGTKTLLVSKNGTAVASGYSGYTLDSKPDGSVEQNAGDWWNAVICSVREACRDTAPSEITALSLSTQGASSLLVDRFGNALMPAMTWMDTRGGAQLEQLENKIGGDVFYKKSGWRLSSFLDAVKLLWLSQNKPELVNNAAGYVSTIEFVNYKLTGRFVCDPTNAAIRQICDINKSDWDDEILEACGGSRGFMPELLPSGEFIGTLTKNAAYALGLDENVKVYNGAHDQYCAMLGAGMTRADDLIIATGSAWVLAGVFEKAVFTENYIACCPHPVSPLWGGLISLPTSGAALEWYKNSFIGDLSYRELDGICETRKYKSRSLLFHPHLSGATFPNWQDEARGSFSGLSLAADKYDLALAVMEGVAFQMRASLDAFEKYGCGAARLFISGGAAKSSLWTNIMASLAKKPLERLSQADTPALGAAAIAAAGAGIYKSLREASEAFAKSTRVPAPDKRDIEYYNEKYDLFLRSWDDIKNIYGGAKCRL